MNIEEVREYCLSKKHVSESFPFGPVALVFKVHDKMFLLLMMDSSPLQFNVKCDPEIALELREKYSAIIPGYHMSKKHWNTIFVDGSLSATQLQEQIDNSYALVLQSLPKKVRENLQ